MLGFGSVGDSGRITSVTGLSAGNSPVQMAYLNMPYNMARIFATVPSFTLYVLTTSSKQPVHNGRGEITKGILLYARLDVVLPVCFPACIASWCASRMAGRFPQRTS